MDTDRGLECLMWGKGSHKGVQNTSCFYVCSSIDADRIPPNLPFGLFTQQYAARVLNFGLQADKGLCPLNKVSFWQNKALFLASQRNFISKIYPSELCYWHPFPKSTLHGFLCSLGSQDHAVKQVDCPHQH